MRRIDKLIYLAITPPFLVALLVLTFIVFVQEFGRLSEIFITKNASIGVIALSAAYVLPGIMIFSLPLGFLIGTLVGLSGLSGESQITALRACGIPLRRILRPVLLMACCVGLVTGVFSTLLLPGANDVLFGMRHRFNLRHITTQVQPRVFNEDFQNVVFYMEDLSVDKQSWSGVFLADKTNPDAPRMVLAERGEWITDPDGRRLQLHLINGSIYEVNPQDPSRDNVSLFRTTDIPIPIGPRVTDNMVEERPKQAFERSMSELWSGSSGATGQDRIEERVELHRRISIPFSVIGFALIGLTLGAYSKKSGKTMGFVLSVVMVLLFYVLFMNGLRLASVGTVSPWLGAWGAIIILALLGIGLLVRAERTSRFAQSLHRWNWKARIEPFSKKLHVDRAGDKLKKIDYAILDSTNRIARSSFPKVLDVYMSRGFLTYFLWAAVACSALFVVFTLFDLLDDIIRNNVALSFVVDYFLFLMPQILMIIVPMSILLAILIHFGILEKASEITALKAGGWSLYRISAPVLLIAGVICVSLYFIQDYVLPYANIRQDSIRQLIKGRAPRTSRVPQRNWIFGESDRIYNYDYFDPGQDTFVGLNIFEIDFDDLEIERQIYASRARILSSGDWVLEEGWRHDFRDESRSFDEIQRTSMTFPEKAPYFEREIFEPKESSKMTYLQLKQYINYLMQSGYNATELQVELYKKISFPLSCVVMALLGVPFSFSMGKRGAFFGITASIGIAIAYWVLFSVFEKMGAYGLLIPFLAAWSPNVIFSAAGLALLLKVRT
jgi:LPS export ABC transporter permease LptG/LPS export ABC transporter permease LptF